MLTLCVLILEILPSQPGKERCTRLTQSGSNLMVWEEALFRQAKPSFYTTDHASLSERLCRI